MRTITVKNVPDDIYESLKQSAAENRRSINREVIICIEKSVGARKREEITDILARARKYRRLTAKHPVTDREFTGLKKAGRP